MYNLGPALWSFEAMLPDHGDGLICWPRVLADAVLSETTCGQRFLVDNLVICYSISGDPDHSWGTTLGSWSTSYWTLVAPEL